jgi:hypothetical protein
MNGFVDKRLPGGSFRLRSKSRLAELPSRMAGARTNTRWETSSRRRNGSLGPIVSSKGILARQVTRQGLEIDEGLPNMPSEQGIGYQLLVAYNEADTTHKACARN